MQSKLPVRLNREGLSKVSGRGPSVLWQLGLLKMMNSCSSYHLLLNHIGQVAGKPLVQTLFNVSEFVENLTRKSTEWNAIPDTRMKNPPCHSFSVCHILILFRGKNEHLFDIWVLQTKIALTTADRCFLQSSIFWRPHILPSLPSL